VRDGTVRLSNGAALEPWRCAGTLASGRPCGKLLAEVDYSRPMAVSVVCGRCSHQNTLLEAYVEPASRIRATMVARGDTSRLA
jgi:phage FluMu protein Com